MSYTDNILDIIEKTKRDAETALKQSSASSASFSPSVKREDFETYEEYSRAKRLARSGKMSFETSSPSEEKAKRNPHYEEAYEWKKEGETILPNRKNYDNYADYSRDKRLAMTGRKVFESGAWDHGVNEEFISSLDNEITSFFAEQNDLLKTNPFGDTTAADAASSKITEIRNKLKTLAEYRVDNAHYLGEDHETIKNLDDYLNSVNDSLRSVEDAWNNAKVTYIEFGGDEALYKDALMRGQHDYETFDEVKAALANPGRVSRMSAEELEYLSNYGLNHGYSDPAEYDKEIAELWDKIEFGGAEYGKDTEIGKELRSKIVSLEAARDTLAEYQAAWSSYTPFFNAEDFEAESKYRGGGDLVTQYINAASDEERAELKTELSTPRAESVDGGYKLSYSLPEDVVFTYDIMTDEEISMYNYLYNTQGEEAANVFLDTMSGLLKQRDRERDLAEITAFAQEHPIIGTGVSFLTNVGSALLAPGQLIANIVGAEDTAQDLGILADVTGSLRGGASEYIEEDLGLGGAGKVGYGVLTSVVDMLIARKAAGLTAGAGTQKLSAGLTQAIMSSEAASATMADANRRGLSGLQVAGLGVGSAAIEWLTEKYSIEALMSKPKTALGYWAKNVIAEGSEEAVAEIAGEMLDRVIAGDKSETMIRYHELVAGGMDPKEASRKVLLDNLKDVGLASLTGALSGALQSAPAAISFKKSSLDNGRIIKDDGGEDILIREALKLGEDSEAYKLALAAQEKLSAKEKLSSSTLGSIVLAGGEELVTAYEAAIESKRRLADYEAAVKKFVSEAEDAQEAFEGAAVKKPVSEAEDVQEAFDDAEVREAAEREKAPIIDLESNTALLGNPNVRQQLDINEFSGDIRAHMDSVMRLAEEFGQKVNFYDKGPNSDGKVENGFRNHSDGSINVNVYAKNPYAVVFVHELVHGTENAKSYSQLQTAVERYLNKEVGKGEFAKRANAIIYSRKGTEWSVTPEGAYKEVVANFLSQELFQNEDAVKRFVADNRRVGQRILEAIRSMLRKVTMGKAGYGSLKDAERLFAKALRQTEKAEVKSAKEGSSASSAEKSDAYLIDGKKANAREISADLGRRLKAGEITSEDYDELFEKYVASSPEFRGEVEGELMGIMDSTEAVGGGIAQEKQFSVSGDEDSETLAAVEAQGRELLDSYIESEPPAPVEHEYDEGDVNLPTTDYLRGRIVGYDSVRDALDALAKGRLSKEKGVELAKLIGMPELDGEVVVPFRTWVTLDSLPMYNRRDTGELVPVAGYALPSPNMMGLWVHYYDAQHRTHSNEFFTWDEITKTKAQHIPTKEELDSYNEWLEENSQLVPESTVPTAEEQQEINEKDHLFISEEESAHAEGVFEALPTRAKSYVNRALKGFKVRIADIFGVPYTRLASSGIAEAGNAIVSDYLNNGGGFNEEKMDGIFEKLLDNLKSVDSSFYEQYQGVLRELRDVKGLAISKDDASSIPGGLTAFNNRSNGRIGYVGLLENKRKKGSSFIPVDTFYQGMSEKYPELFPAEIVNPADQLERLLAEAKEIRASRNLAFEVSKEERKYLLSEFRAALGTMTHPLSNAIRYNEEASEDGSAEDVESAEDETRRFIKNGIKAQKLLPKIKKLEWQLLLSDHDKAVVGDLLSGYVTEDAVREREANAEEILAMYHARQPYEKLAREMKEYKKKVIKEQLRNAEEIVGDVSAWRDKEKFGNLRYNLIDFRRILRDIAPDEETAERAIRYYEEPIRRHSAEAVRYIQKMRDRVKALDLSRKVRDGDAISESAAVQLLGEIRAAIDILEERMKNAKASAKGRDTMTRDGQTLEQWKKDEAEIWVMNKSFSDPAVKARIERGVEEFTNIYDEIHDSMNMALAKVGQQPIPKRAGYFPHFEKEIDMGFIAKARRLIGIGSEVSPLPTEIAGRTGDFRPNKEYFANAMKRMVNDRGKQKETVLFDAVEGFDRYVEAAARQIYYTEDIVKLRSLDRYFRTAAGDDGIKTQIERIQNNGSSEAEQQILIDHIMKDARYQMSGFVQFLTEYTNKLAGKKSIVDRGIESLFGRDVFNISKAITKKYAINATSSLSSALTNFLPWAQGSGGYSLRDFWLGAWQLLHGDGIVDDSVFATARQGSTRLVRSKLEIAGDWSRFVFEFVDRLVATTTVQARYNYNIRRGLSNDAALSDADAWSAALIGDRSRAMQPLAFESHNPLVKVLTQFQLEVNNNILRTFKDIPRDLKTIIDENDTGTAALKITNYITKTAIYTWVLNEVMERIVGRGPGGDFLGIIFDAIATGTGWDAFEELLGFFGLDDEDEEEEETGAWQAVAGTAYNIAQEIPFVGGLLGGGRVPIASLFSDVPRLFNTFTDKEASWQYKAGVAFSELSTPLLYLTMPFGASQIKKSGTALIDWLRGGSYGYDKEGNELLKYPVAGGGDLLSGLLFGPTATEGGREWIESGFGNLGRKGTEAYKYAAAAGADEQEAWELVKKVNGLKSKDDPSEDASKIEQVAYLDSLDVDDEIKAGIYRGLIATEDKEGSVKDAEAELFDRCTELGITEGKLYRMLSDIRLLKNELREAGEEGTTAKITEFLINAELLESAKPAVYSQIVSFSTFEKLYSVGIPKDQAEDVAYEIACLTPVGKNKSVTEVQKASVVLKSGLPEETAAQFIAKDTREKLSAVSEYGASVRGYVALKEYLLYNDEDSGAPSMEEAKNAINAISRGSVVSVPGMPDVALELTSSEKAALWQMMNSAWKPEKNPFSTSVGRKVYNALNALKEEEE